RESVEVSLRSLREKGISYTLVETTGCLKQAMVDITLANQDIRYVVVSSYSDLEVGCSGDLNTKTDVTDMVRCPLVVVGA
ncbi:MAG: hypothetical protein WB554_03305, partial [Desulfomonilaceae bacterium]